MTTEQQKIICACGILAQENMAASDLVLTREGLEQVLPEFVARGIQEYTDFSTAAGVRFEAWPELADQVRDSILRYRDMKATAL